MMAAARLLEGRLDFAAFQAVGGSTRTTERIVSSSSVARDASEPALVTYDISGNGFLRYMVRNIVGTLVEVGRGRRPVEWVGEVLRSRDRASAGPTAPPEGLFLVSVEYVG
jgi:tRNA pseudouridine38-40 synthase